MARTPKQIIRTIGHCIYCDSGDGKLSEEHVIPFSLGANLTLAQASCARCARITGEAERQIARPIAGMLRARLGIQTRNRNGREPIPKKLYFGDEQRRVEVLPDEFPSLFSYPIFAKPGIVEGRARSGAYLTGDVPWSLGQDESYARTSAAFMAKHGCTGFEHTSFRPAVLMTFIAKVAHAAAVALLGPDGFQPLVRDAAIDPGLCADDLLGGTGGAYAPNPHSLHYIEVRQIEGPAGSLIFAKLMWFANLAGEASPLTTFPGSAPPPLLAIVGRPIDDRLVGRLGYIDIRTNGEEAWGIRDLPAQGIHVPAPDMRPPR